MFIVILFVSICSATAVTDECDAYEPKSWTVSEAQLDATFELCAAEERKWIRANESTLADGYQNSDCYYVPKYQPSEGSSLIGTIK